MSKDQSCEGCGFPLSIQWSDTHGVGVCCRCALPYTVFHYEGEGDDRKRVDKPPSCPIFPEWIEVGKRYHAETGRKMFPGEFSFLLNSRETTYCGATQNDMREWHDWLKAHKDELPKPRTEEAA